MHLPHRLISGCQTRALRSGRRQTGPYQTNRQSRWRLSPDDPQFASEEDAKLVLVKLYCQLFTFTGAPEAPQQIKLAASKHFGMDVTPNKYRDPLTRERLSFHEFIEELEFPTHGHSQFHIGHLDPTLTPRHFATNIDWRSMRSNLIQGNLTIPQARTKFVELIARYFDLGEVAITPEE